MCSKSGRTPQKSTLYDLVSTNLQPTEASAISLLISQQKCNFGSACSTKDVQFRQSCSFVQDHVGLQRLVRSRRLLLLRPFSYAHQPSISPLHQITLPSHKNLSVHGHLAFILLDGVGYPRWHTPSSHQGKARPNQPLLQSRHDVERLNRVDEGLKRHKDSQFATRVRQSEKACTKDCQLPEPPFNLNICRQAPSTWIL